MTVRRPVANPLARPSSGTARTQRAPIGCFCGIMPISSGCLTCTCPDCGAFGRYGAPILHAESCI